MVETTEPQAGQATATWATTLDGVPLTGTITINKAAPPTPPVSMLSGLTLSQPSLQVGETGTATVTRTAPFDMGMMVSVTAVGVVAPSTVSLRIGVGSASFAYQAVTPGAASITATGGGSTRASTLTVTPKPPPPPSRLNVRDFGASGGGLVDDAPAIHRALAAAGPGKEIYLPTGSYLLGSGLSVQTSGVTLTGDGDATRLVHGMRQGIHIGGAGQLVSGVQIKSLCLYGAPLKFRRDGNDVAHAVLVDAANDVTVQDCLFVGPGHAVYQANAANGLLVSNCRVQGFGRVAFGLGDGSTVSDCHVTQNYPDPTKREVDYQYYIHNSAKNVLVERCTGAGGGGYAVHSWAQAIVGPGGPVTVQDCQFTDCSLGAIFACSPPAAGRIQGLTIQRNSWIGPAQGSCVVLRQGDGVLFQNNVIRSGRPATEMKDCQGLAVGQWSPNEAGGSITNAVIRNNTVEGWGYGIYLLASNGGRFANTVLGPNQISNCLRLLIADPTTPGVTVVP